MSTSTKKKTTTKKTAPSAKNNTSKKVDKEVVDVNGVTIGYIIMAEKVQGSNGFVNIVDDMTKSVTLVSLGLVISILLFMF